MVKLAIAVSPATSSSAKAGNVFAVSLGSNGRIYWTRGLDVPFVQTDLTIRLGAPLGTGKPNMYPNDDPDGGAVVYRATSGHVQLMFQEFGSHTGSATVFYYRGVGVGGRFYELAFAGGVWSACGRLSRHRRSIA